MTCPLQAYFDTKATNIQRHWRGFWSRKYLFDFYARKLYLQHVAQINAQVSLDEAPIDVVHRKEAG